MIQCDACEDWFHCARLSLFSLSMPLTLCYVLSIAACIGLSQKEMKGQSWVCPNCKKKGIKLA